MTAAQAIAAVDSLRPNSYSEEQKLDWLKTLEERIRLDLLEPRGLPPPDPEQTDQLSAPVPFDRIYIHWLESRVDYWNGEIGKFNNSHAMFMAEYEYWREVLNREHPRRGRKRRYW